MRFYFLLLLLLSACSSNVKNSEPVSLIELDPSEAEYGVDISHLFSDDLQVVPLETNNECLLGDNFKILLTDSIIYCADSYLGKIHIFNLSGMYQKSVCEIGRGAGEVSRLGEFYVHKDTIYCQDYMSNKIVGYSIANRGYKEYFLEPEIYYSDFYIRNNKFYFLTNYVDGYNLVESDRFSGNRKEYLPYDNVIEENESYWDVEEYYSEDGGHTYILLSNNDTLFVHCDSEEVIPWKKVKFITNALPADLYSKSGYEILRESLANGYVYGLDKIEVSGDFLFGGYGMGNEYHLFYYSLQTKETKIAESCFTLADLGGLPITRFKIFENKFLFYTNAIVLKKYWDITLSKKDFKYKELIGNVVENLSEDSNPILFIRNFKS